MTLRTVAAAAVRTVLVGSTSDVRQVTENFVGTVAGTQVFTTRGLGC